MSAADHDVKPGDSQDEVCKCGHLHAEHYGKVATARCTVCEGPARPVEDREPVGPYAPTRAKPLPGEVQADIAAQRDARTFEAGYRQGWRERDTPGCTPRYPDLTIREASAGSGVNVEWLAERFDRIDTALTKLTDLFVDSRDEIERTMTRPEYLRWKEGFDFGIKGFAEEMATARRETRESFERGRQQGDTDRAQRIQHLLREQFERGRQQGLSERGRTLGAEFDRGKAVGAANREAELLDQGWTPPGATSVDARLLEIVNSDVDGPTDYEVWRDALTLSATNVFPIGGTGEASTFDDDRRAQILADAEFFRDHLINYPTISPDEAEQASEDQISHIDGDHIDGDETSWGPGAKIPTKETPGAEADYPF